VRTLLLLVMLFVASPAWAAWTLVKSVDGASHYIDPLTLRTTGHVRRISELTSTTLAGKGGAASHRLLVEYDCKAKRYRLLQLTAFTEPMGRGTVFGKVDSASNGDQWHQASPGTVAADVLSVVCGL
jgi:hypothetical protein